MAGAVVAVLVFIPLIFLIKEWKKVEKQS
jgi:hypothetical protein